MRLAVAIAGKDAPQNTFVVWRGFESSIRKASECGYHGVELALRDAAEIDPRDLERWLERSGIEVSCISTGQVFAASGLYFTHPDPERRERVVQVFAGLVRLAKDFGGMVNIGSARGFFAADQPADDARRLCVETAQRVADIAGPLGVSLVVEPVNRYETNFINTLDEGAQLIGSIDRPNIGLMPDLFHMNIEEVGIGESLVRHARLVRYIHFADSNRMSPGKGHLDFREVFSSLGEAGFDGWASVEILPIPQPDTAAREAARHILPLITQHNSRMVRRKKGT
jgi:sugar phosphate isomerase/epimerase